MNSVSPIEGTRKKTRGISGRVFVFCFVPVLVFLSLLTFGIGYRFQVIMNRLETVRSLWPNASQELKNRYDRLSQELNDSGVEQQKLSELTTCRARFDQTSQFDTQSMAATSLEQVIPSLTKQSSWSPKDFEQEGLTKLVESETERGRLQGDWLGWLTVKGLRLKLPPIFAPKTI